MKYNSILSLVFDIGHMSLDNDFRHKATAYKLLSHRNDN